MSLIYFPHSTAATRSPELIRLRKKYGYEGIGLYWAFLERLAEAGNAIAVSDLDAIAFDMQCNADECTCNASAMHVQCTLHALIFDFNLFKIEDEFISAPLLSDCENKRAEIATKRKEAAQKRWHTQGIEKSEHIEKQADTMNGEEAANASAMQVQCKCNASAMQDYANKEKEKEKENKINNRIPPLSPNGGKERKTGKFCLDPANPPEWMSADLAPAFKSWLDYKRSRGQGYANERTARVCYDNLIKLSNGEPRRAMDIVNFSVGNNYAGLFPPDGRVGSGPVAPNAVHKPVGGGAKW